jgi:hypothetical protein
MDERDKAQPQGYPETVLITIDIGEDGRVTRWTASSPEGQELEDWLAVGEFLNAAHSHTWTVGMETYLVIRDILRYLNNADWKPGTVV